MAGRSEPFRYTQVRIVCIIRALGNGWRCNALYVRFQPVGILAECREESYAVPEALTS
jgi:hypothetical protein